MLTFWLSSAEQNHEARPGLRGYLPYECGGLAGSIPPDVTRLLDADCCCSSYDGGEARYCICEDVCIK